MSEKKEETEAQEETETREVTEETVEEKPAEKEKPKVEKKRKEEKGIFSYYKIDEKGLTRLRPFCERCGPGFFMADHGNRYTCGHCGFTRYKQNQK
ncbi:MAG: 30S ribosomal protein S27ae [Candidatus Bathyarchaeia archaeon]